MTRRDAIKSAALLPAATSALGQGGPATKQHVTQAGWHERAMRWLTMNLVQDDPGKVDLDWWLDYLKRAHVDAASWNSGGIIAFYPTRIPYHRRNANLGNSDPLGYLVEGCRKMGLIVTARVDHHATYPEAAQAHPEWISRDERGEMRKHWAAPELYLTCTLGPYNEEFMTSVMVEIEDFYRVDGFNHNRWLPQRMCYCDWCRKAFRSATGLDLPRGEGPSDPSWARYMIWREDRIFELWDGWNAAIQKINPNAFVLPGIGSERDRLNMSKVRSRAKTLYLDYQGREGLTPPWMAGKKGKELRAVLGLNPAGITFSVGITDKYRWKDSVQTGPEIKVWVCTGAAHGLRPKMAKFAGVLHDRRWTKPVEELYTWLHKAEPYLRNEGYPIATAGILFSQRTARFHGPAAAQRGYHEQDFSNGVYQTMIEARIPTDIVHEDLLDDSDLSRFRVLILPNIACLSDAQCDRLRRFVSDGGSLVATFESSLYDEWGKRRGKFGLGDLFGVEPAGEVQGPMKNSYLRLVKEQKSHPLLRGFGDAERMVNGIFRLPVRSTAAFSDAPLMLVAPYPDLPMEEVYPRDLDRNDPQVFARQVGKGRVVYLPFDLDRTAWEMLDPDHLRLLENCVRWAAFDDIPLEVQGPGVLDLAVWRQKSSMAVHLVNLTNPMMMKGPFRTFYPSGAQRVRVRLPDGKRPRRVSLLAAGSQPRFEARSGWLSFEVPSFELHEIAAIDF